MIEPATDRNGRLLWVSIVPPLSAGESAAVRAALQAWAKTPPVIWTHDAPTVEIIQLHGRIEPDIEDEP